MKKLFIVNSRAESKALARFKSAYFDYSAGKESETRVVYTEFAGHAAEVASKAAEEDDLLVIACGGDGTIHEVANALAESSTPLAVIPLGTGNDFTRSVMNEDHRSNCEVCIGDVFRNNYKIKDIDLSSEDNIVGKTMILLKSVDELDLNAVLVVARLHRGRRMGTCHLGLLTLRLGRI